MEIYQWAESHDNKDVLITASESGIVVSLYDAGSFDIAGQDFIYAVKDGKLVPVL